MGLRGLDVLDETIATITKECKGLESLDISQCSKLTEAAATSIAQNCEKLKVLKAAYCAAVINDPSLKKIAESCKLIRTLDISYCKAVTDESLEAFAKNKTSFVGLFINGLENVSTLGVVALLRYSYTTLECLEMALLDPVSEPVYHLHRRLSSTRASARIFANARN